MYCTKKQKIGTTEKWTKNQTNLGGYNILLYELHNILDMGSYRVPNCTSSKTWGATVQRNEMNIQPNTGGYNVMYCIKRKTLGTTEK